MNGLLWAAVLGGCGAQIDGTGACWWGAVMLGAAGWLLGSGMDEDERRRQR